MPIIMAFKSEGKEMYPIVVFAKCCWSIHSKVVRLGKHVHSKKKSNSHTNSAISLQFYVAYMPCYFNIYIVYFFNIWFGMVQHQKLFGGRQIC